MNDRAKAEVNRDGFAIYSERMLRWYDFLVHRVSNHLVWKCPTRQLYDLYRVNVSAHHLEIGVGTGLLLDGLGSQFQFDALTLADANQNCLSRAAGRLARYRPRVAELNLLVPDGFGNLQGEQFHSIGLNYVLHCLPNGLDNLPHILPEIQRHLRVGGVFFGSTILGVEVGTPWLARRVMKFYNQRAIFGNERDNWTALETQLNRSFTSVEIQQTGCVALFRAWCSA